MRLPDFKDREGKWLHSTCIDGEKVHTIAGKYWSDMQTRCILNGRVQTKHKRYVGCENHFEDFQSFAEWCQSQVGYGNKGWHLDKDILSYGNLVYSRATCCFVPQEVNKFFCVRKYGVKELPVGATKPTPSGKYCASFRVNGKRVVLGTFCTILEAHNAYKKAKEDKAKELARKWEGIVDDRVITALLNFEVPYSYN